MSAYYSPRPKQAAAPIATPRLSLYQWLLLGRGLWWLSAFLQFGLLAMPVPGWHLPAQLGLTLWWLTLLGLLCLLIELLYNLLHSIQKATVAAHSHSRYVCIRLPMPQEGRRATALAGAEFWHAVHGIFDTQPKSGGHEHWLMVTLSAAADEKVSFGALIGSQSGSAAETWLTSLRHILGGYAPDALIELAPDPLLTACQHAPETAVLACVELLPMCGPEYLLRSMEEAGGDMLTPLLAQLRPHAALLYSELQLALRPCHTPMNAALGWRARLVQRLLHMTHYSPGSAAQSDRVLLEHKLNAPVYEVIVRLSVVAASHSAARQALQEAELAFSQYTRRSGQRTQRLRRIGSSHQSLDWPRRQADAKILAGDALDVSHGSIVTPWRSDRPQKHAAFVPAWLRGKSWSAGLPLRYPPPRSMQRLLLPFTLSHVPAILSSAELAGLWHLPGAEQAALVKWLSCRFLAPGAQAHIQTAGARADLGPRITLGHALRPDGSLAAVGPYLRDLRQILHVTSGMGGGKSRLLANLAQQLLASGFVLIDGKGDDAGNLATTVCSLISPHDERRLVILDMTDSEWPVGINPLLTIDRGRQGALDQLSAMLDSIFARIDAETWQQAPGMQQFLGNATRLVLEAEPEPTLMHVQRVLVDERYRKQLLEHVHNLEISDFWCKIFPKMGEGQRSSMTALLRRFERLLGSELVRAFISQQHSTFHFADAFEQGLIVICPIPHVRYGALASTVAMLIFMAMLRAAFERPGTATTRSDYALIVDEFQVLVEHGATQDVATALTQLRSLGIPSIYAHQTLSQIGDLRDLLMVNAENRVIMRTQEPDASVYARHYAAAGITAADVSGQHPGEHQYARFAVAGNPMPLCSIQPLPWPGEASPDHILPLVWQSTQHKAPDSSDWRSIVPSDASANAAQQRYDRQLAALCHGAYSAELAQAMLECSDQDWALIMQRWPAIAQAQRRYILEHPGCITDRSERQRWLSRLAFARPRLLVEAEYRRLRSGADS